MYSLRKLVILPTVFFNRDPRKVGRALLGKVLVRKSGKTLLAGRIVETEAYLDGDPAAHSFVGRTARNDVLFGPPGRSYVYFIYGNHYCLNVSCLPDGVPGGVLFRAVEPLAGVEEMARARGMELESAGDLRRLTRVGVAGGAPGITRSRDNGKSFTDPKSDLFIADDGYRVRKVEETVRIGITKAAEMPLRYVVAGNPFVSKLR
jgi:DNA-3-methyladenine glycosylase